FKSRYNLCITIIPFAFTPATSMQPRGHTRRGGLGSESRSMHVLSQPSGRPRDRSTRESADCIGFSATAVLEK
ncbi:hypothetical protein B0H14DRAFT_2913215, partial [Mycena olivaceomarginata]